jgi:TnpA family transposase
MPGIRDTAYPQLKPSPSEKELDQVYTPALVELVWAEKRTREDAPRVGLLALLKTFQLLGYFVPLSEVPDPILQYVAHHAGCAGIPPDLKRYDSTSARRRHMLLVRDYLGVKAWGSDAQAAMQQASRQAACTLEDLADIINFTLEELVRQRFELPAFSVVHRAAQHARATVNREYQAAVSNRLTDHSRSQLQILLTRAEDETKSPWHVLKSEPKQPTAQNNKDFLQHLEWLREQGISDEVFQGIPDIKVKQFAAEARSLDVASMNDLTPTKRLTLAAALVLSQTARALDDVADMFVRLMQRIHNHAYDALLKYQAEQVERTDHLVATLQGVTLAYRSEGTPDQRLSATGALLEPEADRILEDCEAHQATARRNYFPFLAKFYCHQRSALFRFLETVELVSTSGDLSTIKAIRFLLAHKANRQESIRLPFENDETGTPQPALDLSFVGECWWPLVAPDTKSADTPSQVVRRWFELCAFTQIMQELKSADLCVPGSDRYSDFRSQFVSDEEYQHSVVSYGERAGIATDPVAFIKGLRRSLEQIASRADSGFPENEYLRIENGEAVLKRLRRKPDPVGMRSFERNLKDRMMPVGILDILVDTQEWLNWTRHFGPVSGLDTKLDNPVERYLTTTFCYGFDFGPTQTSRSIRGLDRRQVAFINQRHVTEETLNDAITTVVNGYNEFPLPKIWGLGKHASADGTKWDLYTQNLASEYHIRYGGYGGIGYYLVSDIYIALFSRFTTCGSWEGHHILDFLVENESDVKPGTIHADTQGQSAAIFGLAHLLGIRLQPRIRNWKGLHFFRPSADARYEHIDCLFSKRIDWDLIQTMLPELLRVAVSIAAGKVKPSTVLRRLATYSRKNKLYFAFRELGYVVRTMFLLEYLSDVELRRLIQSATNKSERFNQFVQWVAFGGGALASEGIRDEQRKFIKYNHLVANLLIYHNVITMTKALERLATDGHTFDEELVSSVSPYLTEHINRFGRYTLKRDRVPEPLEGVRILRMPPRSETGNQAAATPAAV